jgi:adenosine deaminase
LLSKWNELKCDATRMESMLAALPKADLHFHLDGTMRLQTLLELAIERNIELPTRNIDALRRDYFPLWSENLAHYLQPFAFTTSVLQDAESLQRLAREAVIDCADDGVRYLEARFAPFLHINNDKLSFDECLHAVASGLEQGKIYCDEHYGSDDVPFRFAIICCALRSIQRDDGSHVSPGYAELIQGRAHDDDGGRATSLSDAGYASLQLARSIERFVEDRERNARVPIVALDLAGPEDGHPAHEHRDAFALASKLCLRRTVHAGEADGPLSVHSALADCGAQRIGHGFHLMSTVGQIADGAHLPFGESPERFVDRLIEYVAASGVTLEVCPMSNMQTMPKLDRRLADHAIGRMVERRVPFTLCTDNTMLTQTPLSREYANVVRQFDWSARQTREVLERGFTSAFFPGNASERDHYLQQVSIVFERAFAPFEE